MKFSKLMLLMMAFAIFGLTACEKDYPINDVDQTEFSVRENSSENLPQQDGKSCPEVNLTVETIDIVVVPPVLAGVFGLDVLVYDNGCSGLYLIYEATDGSAVYSVLIDELPDFENQFGSDECLEWIVYVNTEPDGSGTTYSQVLGPFYLGYNNASTCGGISPPPPPPPPTPVCESGCFDLLTTQDITVMPYGAPTILIMTDTSDDSCINALEGSYAWVFTNNDTGFENIVAADFSTTEADYTLTECGIWTAELVDRETGEVIASFCFSVGSGSLSC